MNKREIFWRLIGPSNFILSIANELQSLPVVAVSVPANRLLPEYLNHISHEIDQVSYSRIDMVRLDDRPIMEVMVDQVLEPEIRIDEGVSMRKSRFTKPSDLVGQASLERAVIVVNRDDVAARFDELMSFISDFAAAATREKDKPSPSFLLDIPPELAKTPEVEGLGESRIKVFEMKNIVSRLDMMTYTSHLMVDRREDSPISPNFLATVVSYIAGWDPGLASLMATQETNDILDPWPMLADLGSPLQGQAPGWASGTVDWMDGREVYHPVWLASNNMADEFDRVLWAAHLTEVFPWLEERRLEFATLYADKWDLRSAREARLGIETPEDMELGQMFYNLLNGRARMNANQIPFLNVCKEVRHNLAHQRPVSSVQIARLDRLFGS